MEALELILKIGLWIALIAVVAVCLLLLGLQHSLMYRPRKYSAETVASSAARLLRYPLAGEGEQVSFLFGQEKLPDQLWILCSGNSAVALCLESLVVQAEKEGVGFCLFDLPGYGLSEGKAYPSKVRASMVQLREALAENYSTTVEEIDSRIRLFGHSIGAASALIAAEVFGTKRLVLISPFTTMTEMSRRSVGWPLCNLNLHRYDNRARMRSLAERGGKATILHGNEDGLIPIEMSRELAEKFPDVVTLIEVPGAGHTNILGIAEQQILKALAQSE